MRQGRRGGGERTDGDRAGGYRAEKDQTVEGMTKMAKEAAYVAVGLGVLGFQKSQVRRRELVRALQQQLGQLSKPTAGRAGTTGTTGIAREDGREALKAVTSKAVRELDRNLGVLFERLDAGFDAIAEELPPRARIAVRQAREVRDQLRTYLMAAT